MSLLADAVALLRAQALLIAPEEKTVLELLLPQQLDFALNGSDQTQPERK